MKNRRILEFVNKYKFYIIAALIILAFGGITMVEQLMGVFDTPGAIQAQPADPDVTDTGTEGSKDETAQLESPDVVALKTELTHNLYSDGEGAYLAFSETTFAEYTEEKSPEKIYEVTGAVHTVDTQKFKETYQASLMVGGGLTIMTLERNIAIDGLPTGVWTITSEAFDLSKKYYEIGEPR